MVSKKRLVSDVAPMVWPVTRWAIQTSPATLAVIRSVSKSPVARGVAHGLAAIGRGVAEAMVRASEQPPYYPPPRYYQPTPRTYSEGSDMSFGRTSRDPDLRNLQNITRNLSETADELLEEQEEKRRFDELPEFVVVEMREVRVKAANREDAVKIAELAFKHGQDEDYRIDRDHLPKRLRGNTIEKIRRVSIRAKRYFD